MIVEVFAQHAWLWMLAWQSTLCLAAGLAGSLILRRHPARAHQALLIGLIAAVVIPALSALVKQHGWGLFVEKPAAAASPPATPMATPGGSFESPSPIDPEFASTTSSQKPEPAPSRQARDFHPGRWFMSAWLVAGGVLLARLIARFAASLRLVRHSSPAQVEVVTAGIETAKSRLGIDRVVAVRSSERVRSPVIWCWSSRPVLLIPGDVSENGNHLDWAGIVCHELAHWKRRDHLCGLFAELMLCALPWQGLLWWAHRRLVKLSEEACDDWVIACGRSGVDYAETLLDLTPQGRIAFVPSVVSSRKPLAERIRRLVQNSCGNPRAGLRWSLAAVILAACVTLGIAFAQTRSVPAQGPERMLRFPQDRSLGTLYMRDARGQDWYEGWESAGEAQGNRPVDAGKQVKLQANEETAADLSPLAELRPDDLQMLDFGWKPVTVGSLAPLAKLTGLRALNLQRTKFDPDELRYVTGLQRLEVLRMGDHKLTDASMEYVGKLASLQSLALWGTGISDDGLRHLQGLTKLTFLALNNCTITDDGLRYLHGMTALEGLQLPHTKITDAGLVHLEHLTGLKHINIDGNKITDAGMRHLEKLTRLDNIWIETNPITDAGFASLSKMMNLKELYAARTQLTDAGLVHLHGLEHLYHIIAEGIGDEGIRHLSGLSSLGHLQILDAKVTKASIPHFQAMPSLEKLLLSGDLVDDDLLDALRAALPRCQVWDPQRSREYPMPAWRQKFEAVYRLANDEVLKRIAPPFIPERLEYYKTEHEFQAKEIPDGPDSMTFHWDRKLENWGMSFGHRVGTLNHVLRAVLDLNSYEYEGPKELLDVDLEGDWIVRNTAPQETKLRSLEQLMAKELGWKIHFERRSVDRPVIVATGRFQLQPLSDRPADKGVQLYIDGLDVSGGGTAKSVADLLQTIGDRASTRIIDKTEPSAQTQIQYNLHRSSRPLREMENGPEKDRLLRTFLDNVTRQTQLQFEIRAQPAEVWQVTAENYN